MSKAEGQPVAKVTETTLYPFKGMQGVRREGISLRSVSVVGDRTRAYSIADSTTLANTFLTSERFPGLLKYSTSLLNQEDPASQVNVRTPNGDNYKADSEELLAEVSEAAKRQLTVVRMGRGAYHSMPVSLLSMASIRDIELQAGYTIDPRRFRENVIIETDSDEPYQEDAWVGSLVAFGDREDSARIAIVKLDGRCATVNMDPETGEQQPEILRTIVRNRDNKLGVYASIVREGRILPGDVVYLSSLKQSDSNS